MQRPDLEYTKGGVTITTQFGRVYVSSLDLPNLAIDLLKEADSRGWLGSRDVNRLKPIIEDREPNL